jgi:UDP-glucose 4-epimerase
VNKNKKKRTFNLGTGTGYTVLEVITALKKLWLNKLQLVRRAGDVIITPITTRQK